MTRVDHLSVGLASACLFAAWPLPASFADDIEMVVDEQRTGVRLAGTLVLPEGEGPHPVVVFVQAAGAHPRDEARSEGRHWAHLAEELASAGVGSLRYDNPGTGGSVNEEVSEWEERWTIDDRAAWGEAALSWVREQDDVLLSSIGLLGFIGGSHVAATVAIKAPGEVAYVVMLSASGVTAVDNLVAGQTAGLRGAGVPDEQVQEVAKSLHQAFDAIVSEREDEEIIELLGPALGAMGVPEEQHGEAAQGVIGNMRPRGVRTYLGYDPRARLRSLGGPVLVMNGAEDSRLVHPENLSRMRDALGADERADRSVEVIDGIGHFLEPADSDERVFDPRVVEQIRTWVLQQSNGK